MTPRICLVADGTASEGSDLLAARLRALLDSGWDARLLCEGERWIEDQALGDPALTARIELTDGRDRFPPPRWLLRRPAGLVRYWGARGELGAFDKRLLKLRPDLIHFHSATAARKAIALRKLLDCRVVVSFRWDGGDLVRPRLDALKESADLVLFPDAATLERATARGCAPETAEVHRVPLPNAMAVTDGHAGKSGSLRLVSAGPLAWQQGLEHSVHAVRLLLDMGIRCDYRVLGEGEEDGYMALMFARHQLCLADHVQLVSSGRSLVEELANADVFLDPAVTDATSRTPLLTAQALGVPFVAAHRNGLAEAAGIKVPRRNPRAIADALAALARDPALRARMGEAGRASSNGLPTLQEHLRRTEELYRRALGR